MERRILFIMPTCLGISVSSSSVVLIYIFLMNREVLPSWVDCYFKVDLACGLRENGTDCGNCG